MGLKSTISEQPNLSYLPVFLLVAISTGVLAMRLQSCMLRTHKFLH